MKGWTKGVLSHLCTLFDTFVNSHHFDMQQHSVCISFIACTASRQTIDCW